MEKAKAYESVMSRLRRRFNRGLRVGAVIMFAAGLAACSADSLEQQIRNELTNLQKAVEEGRVRDAMAVVAEDFGGPRGMDRAALHNLLRVQVLGGRRVGVTTTPFQIQVNGEAATVTCDAVLTASGQGQWLPDQAQAYALTLGWRRQDGQWRLHHADWQARR